MGGSVPLPLRSHVKPFPLHTPIHELHSYFSPWGLYSSSSLSVFLECSFILCRLAPHSHLDFNLQFSAQTTSDHPTKRSHPGIYFSHHPGSLVQVSNLLCLLSGFSPTKYTHLIPWAWAWAWHKGNTQEVRESVHSFCRSTDAFWAPSLLVPANQRVHRYLVQSAGGRQTWEPVTQNNELTLCYRKAHRH